MSDKATSDVKAVVEASSRALDNLDKEIKQMQLQLNSKLNERDRLFKDHQRILRLLDAGSGVGEQMEESSEESTIYISNLNTYTSKKTLIEYFGKFGAVSSVEMTISGLKNSGAAYVSLSNITDNDSLSNFEHFVDGSLLKIKQAKQTTDSNKEHLSSKYNERTRSVMVSGYLAGLKQSEIRDHFGQYGEINKYSDTSKKTSKKRNDGYGFIFIKFMDYEAADKATAQQSQIIKSFNLTVKKAKDL